MEQQLGKQDYLAGTRYTIADIALYAYTHESHVGGILLDDRILVIGRILRPRSRDKPRRRQQQGEAQEANCPVRVSSAHARPPLRPGGDGRQSTFRSNEQRQHTETVRRWNQLT